MMHRDDLTGVIPTTSCTNDGYNVSVVGDAPPTVETMDLKFFTVDGSESGQWTFDTNATNSNWGCTKSVRPYQMKYTCVLGGVVNVSF